ncbi:MAG: KEOPS complex subunit Cgi121 [Nitrososphaeria archaeon]
MKREVEKNKFKEVQLFCYGLNLKQPIEITSLKELLIRDTGAIIQVVDPNFIAGIEHAKMILRQTYEAYTRGIFIANKPSLDILLRLLCTKKIEAALKDAGLKEGDRNCAILGFCDKNKIDLLEEKIKEIGEQNNKALELSETKKKFLIRYHDISLHELENYDLATILYERAATKLLKFLRSKP